MINERNHYTLNGFDIYERATREEMDYLLDHMRPEETEEGVSAGCTNEDRETAMGKCRRLVSFYHNGDLVCVGEMIDGDGFRFISCERTTHCLEKGHRFSWLRNFPSLVDWFRRSDDEMGGCGPFVTITPTDYPRALDLYGKAGARIIKTIDIVGRPYWLLDMNAKEC